jgi:glycosyltransferase involved in cell wall biosynthesis
MQSVSWDNIQAKKIYQVIHSDLSGLKELPQWADFTWTPPQKLDGIISVSETAQKGLKKALGLDSIVIENVFGSPSNNRRVFCFMSRSTEEKGFDKALELMDKFEQAGKDYLFIIASQIDPYGPYWERISRNPRFVYANANIYTDSLIRGCDYLVSLSSCESWGYSIREALSNGVAVIGSKGVPEIERVVKDGMNGYLIDRNLTDVDSEKIDKIFDEVPKESDIQKIIREKREEKLPKADKEWERLFKGEER